jgi:hypothetical protein
VARHLLEETRRYYLQMSGGQRLAQRGI